VIQHVLFGVASLNRPPPASPSVSLIRLFYCSVHEKYCSLTFENLNRRVGVTSNIMSLRNPRLHEYQLSRDNNDNNNKLSPSQSPHPNAPRTGAASRCRQTDGNSPKEILKRTCSVRCSKMEFGSPASLTRYLHSLKKYADRFILSPIHLMVPLSFFSCV